MAGATAPLLGLEKKSLREQALIRPAHGHHQR